MTYTKNVNGKIVDMTPDEIAERRAEESLHEQKVIERAWSDLREERNRRLSSCDWTQVEDSSANKTAWAAYRQALRDLPANTADPMNPEWPVKPT